MHAKPAPAARFVLGLFGWMVIGLPAGRRGHVRRRGRHDDLNA